MSDFDARLEELRRGTEGLRAPEGFEQRLAVAMAASAPVAGAWVGAKVKLFIAGLFGVGVAVGVVATQWPASEPAPVSEQAPGRPVVSRVDGPRARPVEEAAPVGKGVAQGSASPVNGEGPPDASAPQVADTQGSSASAGQAEHSAAAPAELVPLVSVMGPVIGRTDACGGAHVEHVELKPGIAFEAARLKMPPNVGGAVGTEPAVVGRFVAEGAAQADLSAAKSEHMRVFSGGWFVVPVSALPAWVSLHGFKPVELTLREPRGSATFVGDVPLRLAQPGDVGAVTVIISSPTKPGPLKFELFQLACGSSVRWLGAPMRVDELEQGAPTYLGLSDAPYLVRISGSRIATQSVVFHPSVPQGTLTVQLDQIHGYKGEWRFGAPAEVTSKPWTLDFFTSNSPLELSYPLELWFVQRDGKLSVVPELGNWFEAAVEDGGVGPPLEAPHGTLSGRTIYTLRSGNTVVQLRLGRFY